MPFIGIIGNKQFNKQLNKEIKQLNLTAISINKNSINNIKNIVFDLIVIDSPILLEKKKFEKIICNTKILLINSDMEIEINCLGNLKNTVITYGYNSKATVTTSSISNEEIMICIQRNIANKNGEIIEPQEIKTIKKGNNNNLYADMVSLILKKFMKKI